MLNVNENILSLNVSLECKCNKYSLLIDKTDCHVSS